MGENYFCVLLYKGGVFVKRRFSSVQILVIAAVIGLLLGLCFTLAALTVMMQENDNTSSQTSSAAVAQAEVESETSEV